MSIADIFGTGSLDKNKARVAILIKLANSDGNVTDEENELILKIAKKNGISDDQFSQILENLDKFKINPSVGQEERFKELHGILKIVLADGVVDQKEIFLSKKIMIGLGFPINQVDSALDEAISCMKDNLSLDSFIEKMIKS